MKEIIGVMCIVLAVMLTEGRIWSYSLSQPTNVDGDAYTSYEHPETSNTTRLRDNHTKYISQVSNELCIYIPEYSAQKRQILA